MRLIDKKLMELKVAQENGTYTLCPRCGRDTMRPDLYTNALSRIADIQVCSECGVDEAKMAFMKMSDSLYTWAGLQPEKPEGNFKDFTGEEAWRQICDTQAVILSRLYERFESGDDPEEIRLTAFEKCEGLTQIWTQPFMMKYAVSDGMLVVTFKRENGNLQIIGGVAEGDYEK